MHRRTFVPAAACWLLGVASACGGSKSGAGATTPENAARDESGNVVMASGGQAVTQEAFNHWTNALEAFEKQEEQGSWSDADCNRIVELFEDANEAQGNSFAEAIYMMGVVKAKCGHQEEALAAYRNALRANPKFCRARAALGLHELRRGNASKAEQMFRQAIRDDLRCTPAYVNLAIIQRSRGGASLDEARKNLRRALAVDSGYLPAFNELALVFMAEAEAGKEQSMDLAEIVCRQAQLLDKDYAPIYNTWGLIKMRRGDVNEALRFFGKARDLAPEMFEAHMNFGQVTLSFRGYEDAKAAFERAVRLHPEDYDAIIGLGAALRGLEQYDAAEEQYKKAQKLQPNRPESYYNIALLYQDYKNGTLEDFQTAKRYFEQFLAKAGGNPKYKDAVASVKRRCRLDSQGRPRPRSCRPGRLQNIEMALEALREMQSMEAEMQQGGGGQ